MTELDEVWTEYWRGLKAEWERCGEPGLEPVWAEGDELDALGSCRDVNVLRVRLRESWKRIVNAWRNGQSNVEMGKDV